ncbi:MAG: YybH family protein [Stellaceae bacterium]
MTRKMLLFAALMLVAAGPALAQSRATIQRFSDEWAQAFNKGDAAAVAAMYTPDAYVLPPGHDMIKGRDAIAAFWRQAAKEVGNAKLVTLDVEPLGRRAAREIGTVTLDSKASPPQPVVGKYVVVWRKIGGRWLLATDIWNVNK